MLCSGTHNEASIVSLINVMDKNKIEKNGSGIWFLKLYGMSNHITYNLANAGYNVSKYLPYGPINSVISYLIRRAEENTSVKGQLSRELKMLQEEIKRRKL